MFAIYECAVCVLAVWIGMTLLFIASVVFLVLVESCTIVVRKLADLTSSDIPLIGRWLAIEPRNH